MTENKSELSHQASISHLSYLKKRMQSILPTPKTDKYSVMLEDDKMIVGASSMQGWRSSMEDAHCIALSLPRLPGGRLEWEGSLTAVFDGHCGSRIAQASANSIVGWVTSPSNAAYGSQDWQGALRSAFINGDADLFRSLPGEQSGCTANAVLLVGTKLLCANAGDSRAVLCRDGAAIALSEDHKPTDAGEKTRIERAGGYVLNGRVNGILSLSRALGDYNLKQAEIAPELQAVTALPDVTETHLVLEDEFVVQACDGIWDCVTNEQAVAFVRHELNEHGDVALACEKLIERCLAPNPAKFGTDNMTVIIINLKNSYLRRALHEQPQPQACGDESAHQGEEET
jgi:serine/threonine protein phosphatase PrpC